jgi:hypothetical protein
MSNISIIYELFLTSVIFNDDQALHLHNDCQTSNNAQLNNNVTAISLATAQLSGLDD